MTVEAAGETMTVDGLTLRFCSERCRATFSDAPARYLAALSRGA
jgi:YHS domain-containing protein